MRDFLRITRRRVGMALVCFVVSATWGLPVYGQQSSQNNIASAVVGQKQENQTDKIRMNVENAPHPFFKDMGIPGAAGVFYPRPPGLATRLENHKAGNFTSHCETELTMLMDSPIRNDKFGDNPGTVAIFQFKDVTSRNEMSGFSPLIELNSSTPLGAAKRSNSPVGFSTAFANSRTFFNRAYITTRENSWWRAAQRWASGPSKACVSD